MAKILVTGAAGFIGARFVESCNQKGIEVVSVDKKEHFDERTEHHGLQFGQIVDREEIASWLKREKPKFKAIIHMGACSRTTETDAAFLKRVNVEASKTLWNYCREQDIPFMYASSAATYGAGEQGYDDNEAQIAKLKPLNLYGGSKQEFDLWALAEEKAGRAPKIWSGFKFFNVYGFGETHKGSQASVVLHAWNQMRERGKIRLFKSHRDGIADGHQKRDFVHVDDVIKVLNFAIEKPIQRGIYNLGSGNARTFLDLARAVCSAMGKPESIEFVDTPIEIRDKYQYFTEARMEKLRAQGYRSLPLTLEQGVKFYIERLRSASR